MDVHEAEGTFEIKLELIHDLQKVIPAKVMQKPLNKGVLFSSLQFSPGDSFNVYVKVNSQNKGLKIHSQFKTVGSMSLDKKEYLVEKDTQAQKWCRKTEFKPFDMNKIFEGKNFVEVKAPTETVVKPLLWNYNKPYAIGTEDICSRYGVQLHRESFLCLDKPNRIIYTDPRRNVLIKGDSFKNSNEICETFETPLPNAAHVSYMRATEDK